MTHLGRKIHLTRGGGGNICPLVSYILYFMSLILMCITLRMNIGSLFHAKHVRNSHKGWILDLILLFHHLFILMIFNIFHLVSLSYSMEFNSNSSCYYGKSSSYIQFKNEINKMKQILSWGAQEVGHLATL